MSLFSDPRNISSRDAFLLIKNYLEWLSATNIGISGSALDQAGLLHKFYEGWGKYWVLGDFKAKASLIVNKGGLCMYKVKEHSGADQLSDPPHLFAYTAYFN